ncbi:MAG: hypothetical protein J0665_18080 [Deltaproteobacteria bacterium]|nr:hypothetical protein [Deltaproteobacteria bacterium]
MSIEIAFKAVCDILRAKIKDEVILGRPDDKFPGVYVWPWRLWEDPQVKNILPPKVGTISSPKFTSFFNVKFIIFISPALTNGGLSKLIEARQALEDNPVIKVAEFTARIDIDNLSDESLSEIFSAAGIPLTICLNAVLRYHA